MLLDEKPELDMVLRAKEHLAKVWSQAHANWLETDTYYWRTFGLWKAGSTTEVEKPIYHPGRAAGIIDHAADTQVPYDPQVDRPPAGEGEEHKIKADRIELWLKAVMDDAALYEPTLPYKTAGKYMVMYGYTVMEAPILEFIGKPKRPKHIKGESKEDFDLREAVYTNSQHGWNPFRIHTPHPTSVLLPPWDKRPTTAIKVGQKYAYELAHLTRQKLQAKQQATEYYIDKDPYDLVDFIEVWLPSWHGMFTGNDMLYIEKNSWGFVPYKQAYAGFGQESVIASGSAGMGGNGASQYYEANPAYLAQGILDPEKETLLMQAQAKAGLHNYLMNVSFLRRGTTQEATEARDQLGKNILQGKPEEWWWEKPPELPSLMFAILADYDKELEFGTFTTALGGFRQPGVSTVGQAALQDTRGSRKFLSVAVQLEHLATLIGQDILRLADILFSTTDLRGSNLSVRGHSITQADIEHNYHVIVSFELIDPVMQLQQREFGLREKLAGLLSDETYWTRDARLTDISGERRRLIEDMIRKHPAVVADAVKKLAAQQGQKDLIERYEEEQKQAQQAAAAPPIIPGEAEGVIEQLASEEPPVSAEPFGAVPPLRNAAAQAVRGLRQPITPETPVATKPGRVPRVAIR